ncbi:MAG: DUF1273 domain-containing protein [Firmicutes bacterium]|nr:DUF1273 domain-containing protein [Bacillota bacterium]
MEEKIKTCCFTGHRPQNFRFKFDETHSDCIRIKHILKKCINRLITEYGVTHFISGMALGVDIWAAEIVLSLKEDFPYITLESALPCETQAVKWNQDSRERYYYILAKCDKESLLQKQYTPTCMQDRNKYMVDNSNYVIAVWNGSGSGTGSTVKYALSEGKTVICIDPTTAKVKKL